MPPSARSVEFRRPNGAAGPRRGLTIVLLGLALWVVLAVENGAEQVDSGWAVGKPATATLDRPPVNPELQGILHHMLQQSHVPILRGVGPAQATPDAATPQIAQRPMAGDGWRSSGLRVAPLATTRPVHDEPSLSPPRAIAEQKMGSIAKPSDQVRNQSNSPIPIRPPEPPDEEETADHRAEGVESAPEAGDASAVAADDAETELESDAAEAGPTDEADASSEATDADEGPALEGSSTADTSQELPGSLRSPERPAVAPPAAEAPADAESDVEVTDKPSNEATAPSSAAPLSPEPQIERPLPPPLNRQLLNLRSRVRSVLKGYYRKPLNSREHDTWEAMHGMLAYGLHSRILQGSPRGAPITAVGWLCYNKPCKGLTLLYVTPQGELRAKWGVGLQGHTGQFLAMLAQCHVSPDYPIHVGKREFTIHDLIAAEQKTCYPKSELTFKLIALQHYLDLNESWVNDQGLEWDIPRLIREEIAQPIRGAACGGTHRLSGLSLTVKARVRRGEPIDGEYARAAEFVEKYEQYAFRLQNRDGSLSTEWFRGRGDDDDIDRRIKTTGHILEWLCYTLSDEELRQPRTVRAVWYLATLMYSNYDHEWEVGPRSHATHALVLYDERVFRPFDDAGVVSFKPTPSTANRPPRRPSSRR